MQKTKAPEESPAMAKLKALAAQAQSNPPKPAIVQKTPEPIEEEPKPKKPEENTQQELFRSSKRSRDGYTIKFKDDEILKLNEFIFSSFRKGFKLSITDVVRIAIHRFNIEKPVSEGEVKSVWATDKRRAKKTKSIVV